MTMPDPANDLKDAVGHHTAPPCKNHPDDVKFVKRLLNAYAQQIGLAHPLDVNNPYCAAKTIEAIEAFQRIVMRKGPPYGRILPTRQGGTTLKALLNGPGGNGRSYPYRWPLAGRIRVTSEFGAREKGIHDGKNHPHGHTGIDLAAAPRTPVLAARDGTVVLSGPISGYGHWVVLRHADGQQSIYGHVSVHHLASARKEVTAGDAIAVVGAHEGMATGPHLHFQINKANTGTSGAGAINPRTVLPPLN
jgi:murein DD-endopeptidase MepM/ murein hydrolase activator NlpD